MAAETQALLAGVEEGLRIRCAIADMRGIKTKDWEASSSRCIRHLWLTDCESLNAYLTNPVCAGGEDKRTELDLEDLRQLLWEDEHGNPKDSMETDQRDKVKWIDTSAMVADPLTKSMNDSRLHEMLMTGIFSQEATPQPQIAKMMKQNGRKKDGGDKAGH